MYRLVIVDRKNIGHEGVIRVISVALLGSVHDTIHVLYSKPFFRLPYAYNSLIDR